MELLLLQHPSANRWVRIRFAAATGLPARPRPRAPLPLRNIAAAFFARSDSQVCTDYPVCDGPAACSAIGCGTCTGYNGVPGTCTSSGCYSCDSFFGGDCDNYCNEYEALGSSCACDSGSYATTGCDSGCTSGCPASCAVGDYGAAEHVTRGPRAVAESPNNSRPRRTPGHPPPSHARVAGTPSLCNSSGAVTGGCSTCSNRPANSTYTNVSATSTCPYACSAGFYRSGSTCPACTSCSGTSSYMVSDCQAGGEANDRVCAPQPPHAPPLSPPSPSSPPSPPPSPPAPPQSPPVASDCDDSWCELSHGGRPRLAHGTPAYTTDPPSLVPAVMQVKHATRAAMTVLGLRAVTTGATPTTRSATAAATSAAAAEPTNMVRRSTPVVARAPAPLPRAFAPLRATAQQLTVRACAHRDDCTTAATSIAVVAAVAACAAAVAVVTRHRGGHSHLWDCRVFEHPGKRLDAHIHHIAARYAQSSPHRLLQQQRRPPRHIVLVIKQLLLPYVEHRSVGTQFSVYVSSQLERSLLQLRGVLRHVPIFTWSPEVNSEHL